MCLLEILQPYPDLHHSCMPQNYAQYISYNNVISKLLLSVEQLTLSPLASSLD